MCRLLCSVGARDAASKRVSFLTRTAHTNIPHPSSLRASRAGDQRAIVGGQAVCLGALTSLALMLYVVFFLGCFPFSAIFLAYVTCEFDTNNRYRLLQAEPTSKRWYYSRAVGLVFGVMQRYCKMLAE